MKTKKPNGAIIYKGPSLLDGKPIVVIAVGLNAKSTNRKTGAMIQTYIIRSRIDPLKASKTGGDFSICGTCPHRGTATNNPDKKQAAGRSCYVTLFQGPLMVYKAFKAGKYADYSRMGWHREIEDIGRGRNVRLGTYGDPSAVPAYVWEQLLAYSTGRTGYTHQLDTPGADCQPKMLMISADSIAAAEKAWAAGYRTFRVGARGTLPIPGKEILCPASKEAGAITTCDNCKLCSGSDLKALSVFIPVHGGSAAYFEERAAVSMK